MKKAFMIFVLFAMMIAVIGCTRQNVTDNGPLDTREPQPSVQGTKFSAPISAQDTAIIDRQENSVEIIFKNVRGVPISLPLTGTITPKDDIEPCEPKISATYKGAPVIAGSTKILDGDEFTIKWDCDGSIPLSKETYSADLTFEYTNVETTQTLYHAGYLMDVKIN